MIAPAPCLMLQVDGGEVGRAQAAQAEAAGCEPTVDMNLILPEPEAEHRSQVVVRGRCPWCAPPSTAG
jgi:cobyric acid synthase